MNILELLQSDGITPQHVSRGEYHSPCPECGGEDRFSSWPDKVNSNGKYMGGRYVCRQCEIYGDAVSYLMKRRGLKFWDAVRELGVDPGDEPPEWYKKRGRSFTPKPPQPSPGSSWRKEAEKQLSFNQNLLRRKMRKTVLDWLLSERGLSFDTVCRSGLGWNDVNMLFSRESWGLKPEQKANGKPKKLWMPAGLMIPFFDETGRLARIRIRRTKEDSYGRYIVISGSSMKPMTFWKNQKAVAIVESELDALLLIQECEDLIGVVAMGSAQAKPDSNLHQRLMGADIVLCCLDSDDAAKKSAWTFWKQYPGFKRWPVISGKDPTEQWKCGVPVRQWIKAGLSESVESDQKGQKNLSTKIEKIENPDKNLIEVTI